MYFRKAITYVSLAEGREEFTSYLRERGTVAPGNRKIVSGRACPAKVIRYIYIPHEVMSSGVSIIESDRPIACS